MPAHSIHLPQACWLWPLVPPRGLIEYVHRLPKRYDATFLFGVRSDTDDITGQLEQLADPIQPTREQIETGLAPLIGHVWQRPPAYSALRVQGRRAYERARSGEQVDLAPRAVFIQSLQVLSYEYPELRLDVHCGSGTYVRALGRDLAASLGTAAVMAALMRTAVGGFDVEHATQLEELTAESLTTLLIPPMFVFPSTPPESLSSDEAQRLRQGQAIRRPGHGRSGNLPAVDAAGRLVAILTPLDDDHLRPVRTFS